MTLATWKAEFYPIPAQDVSAEDAVEHSLRKWRGLLPENMARHGLEKIYHNFITDGKDSLAINDVSCALCVHYNYGTQCTECPLAKVRGAPCDVRKGDPAPYLMWRNTGDPRPMIAALEKALEV